MARHPSNTAEMFADAESPKEIAKRFKQYESAMDESFKDAFSGRTQLGRDADGNQVLVKSAAPEDNIKAAVELLSKSVDPTVLSSLTEQLSGPDIAKDLSLTSPVASFPATNPAGWLVPFDLEAPAKLLVPRMTPLRNKLPRIKGMGTAHRFKRVTGLSNSSTAGVSNLHAGIADTTQTNFANAGSANNLFYNRGPKITWAGDDKVLPYHQFSLSDEVPWSAQFQGQGFQDIRQLSASGVLWASLLFEEKQVLAGRGTNTTLPYQGALPDPVANGATLAVTARAAGAGETGNTATIANVYVTVTAENIFGESIFTAGSVLTSTALSAVTGRVLDVTLTKDVQGAQGYRVYVGTTNGQATLFFAGRTGFSSTATGQGTAMFTIQFTGGGTGGTISTGANPPVADTSAYSNGYDGVLTYCDSPQSGYSKRLNGQFSTSNPGVEYQNAFVSLYNAVKGDPDEVLISGQDRKQLSDALKAGTTTPGYRLTVQQDEVNGVNLGSIVTGLYNEVTGKLVDLTVHPWMPQGNSAIISYQLPWPDSNVSSLWAFVDVQPYMGIAWPVNQLSYDFSSYWLGSFQCQAPAWQAYVGGIQAV